MAAYGLILPKAVLDLPRFPPLNVHGSLLPLYRGAAPVQRAILENYQEGAMSGVSIMQMVEALDAGPVYASVPIELLDKSSDEVLLEMAKLGGQALVKVLGDLISGLAKSSPQDDSKATYAAKLEKAEGFLDFDAPFACVHAKIRAFTSNPGAKLKLLFTGQDEELTLTVTKGFKAEAVEEGIKPGTVRLDAQGLAVACRDYWYRLLQVKPGGKGFMSSKALANGYLKSKNLGICGQVVAL